MSFSSSMCMLPVAGGVKYGIGHVVPWLVPPCYYSQKKSSAGPEKHKCIEYSPMRTFIQAYPPAKLGKDLSVSLRLVAYRGGAIGELDFAFKEA